MEQTLPFYRQETPHSCLPACLRMVFASFGVNLPEDEIRAACDCTAFGTQAPSAVDAARSFGFARTAKHTLSFDELRDTVDQEKHPIVFLNLKPIDGVRETHAVVVVTLSEESVNFFDPTRGERTVAGDVFRAAWALRHGLAILVER